MRPQCPTESQGPGTNPCACRSRWHPIPGASGSSLAKLAWHKPLYRQTPSAPGETGTPQCPGDGVGPQEALRPRGPVAAASRGCRGGSRLSPATVGWLCTSPGCHQWLGHVAVAGSCLLGTSHRGILWQTSFPKAPRLFSKRGQRRCSPPPPVAPANWFPAGSSDRLPKDGSSKPGTAGGEREGCNTLSILPSAEYCLGKTMRLFFKCNLREILAFPARRPPCHARLPRLALPCRSRRQRC